MTITLVGAGTVAGGSTPLTPAYPTGVAAGRVAVLKVSGKPDTNTINTPVGFTAFPNTDGTGGTGSVGVDTGPTRAAIFYRVLDGSETGTVSVTTSAGGSNNSVIDIYEATNGFDTASFAGTTGGDASHDTSWSAAGAADLDLASGDLLVGCSSCCSNAANNIVISSRAVSATGSTFGSVANERAFNNNTGNDSCFDTFDFPVTGGPSSAAPTYTATHSAANSGVTAFARLVEAAPSGGATATPAVIAATASVPAVAVAVASAPAVVPSPAALLQPAVATQAAPSVVAATAMVPQPPLTGVDRLVTFPWEDEAEADRLSKSPLSVDPPNVSVIDDVDTARNVIVFTNPDGDEPALSGGQRDAWLVPDTAGHGIRHAAVPFWGAPQVGTTEIGAILPQHGMILRHEVSGGRRRGIVVDNNIFFGTYWSVLAGIWASDEADAANFDNRQVGLAIDALGATVTVTSSARNAGIVTLTLAASADDVFAPGSYASVNVATASFDGWHLITAVSGTQVTYVQAGDDEAGGAGTIANVFPYDVEARLPDGPLVEVRAKRHAEPDWPDWVGYDDDAGLVLPGGSGNYWSAPAATVGALTQFSIRAFLTMTDWTPAADQTVVAKYVSAGNQRCVWLRVKTGGTLELLYSPAGTTTGSATSTVALPATNGQPLAVRADYDGDGDAVTFYTASTDKGPWSQLGDVRAVAGAGALFNSATAPVEIGSALNGTSNLLVGRVHGLMWFSDLTETTAIVDFHASVHQDGSTSVGDRASVTWTAHGTADLENTAIVDGASAFAVDLDQAGDWASRTTDPTPLDDDGEFGFIVAHLGTDDRSQVSFGPTLASSSLDDFVQADATVSPATIAATVTLPPATAATGAVAQPATIAAPAALAQPAVAVAAAPQVIATVVAFLLASAGQSLDQATVSVSPLRPRTKTSSLSARTTASPLRGS